MGLAKALGVTAPRRYSPAALSCAVALHLAAAVLTAGSGQAQQAKPLPHPVAVGAPLSPAAAPAPQQAPAAPDPAFLAWLEQLWPEARALGVSRPTFDLAFRGVVPDLGLPDLVLPGREKPEVKGQAEFTKPPQDYLLKSYLQKLTEQGRQLGTQHAAALAQIERELGVDRATVLAIWGRETAFGSYRLPHYAVKALATQAYLGRRKEMFRKELLYALKMLEDKILTPEAMRSSWAGALGLTQFMPTDYYNFAYDLDRDGRRDIWNSVPDALASAAKQLKDKGWITGQPWGYEVRLPQNVVCAHEGPGNMRPIGEWAKLGVVRAGGRAFLPRQLEQQAYLMMPGGAYGPAFLVTENFLVIKRYNPSDLYAVFVGHLADRISGGGDFEAPWQAIAQLTSREIEEIQSRLQAAGKAVDKIDGKIGSQTRSQIGAYQMARGISVDCWPTAGLLGHLRTSARQ